jgi:hypothetical protein
VFGRHRRTGAHFETAIKHQSYHVSNVVGGKQGIGAVKCTSDGGSSLAGGRADSPGDPATPKPTYMPDPEAFFSTTCDIYKGDSGSTMPPPAGDKTATGVNLLLTGTYPEGHRSKVAVTDAYTHIALVDVQIGLKDPYAGQGQASGAAQYPDYLAIPSGQRQNFYKVVFSFITQLTGIGRKRVVLLDRWGPPTFGSGGGGNIVQ